MTGMMRVTRWKAIFNPYGVVLDNASLRWAAAESVSETVIACYLPARNEERRRDCRQAYAGRSGAGQATMGIRGQSGWQSQRWKRHSAPS